MKIQLFKNNKGLIHGNDPMRIGCDREGVLKIGDTEVSIGKDDAILPLLFHGQTGDYKATFTDKDGHTYELERVAVRAGRIASPNPLVIEIMELRCQVELMERECSGLRAKIRALETIFDIDSLNFLIR